MIGLYVYRDLEYRDLSQIFIRAAGFSCGILLLVGGANIFSFLIAVAGIPDLLTHWIQDTVSQGWTFLILINVLFLALGCFGESIVYILVLSPVLVPIAQGFGIDPIHFCMVMVFNLVIGMITPPIGATVFVVSLIGERSIMAITRKLFCPWISMVVVLLLVTYIPEFTLYLPRISGFIN